ncbi:MAG: ArnT family glycosyltransferase [Deferribacterales bacterium]
MSETYTSSSLKNSLSLVEDTRFYIFLALYFVALLLPAYWLDIMETTDARYAEMGREMLRNRDYITPFYNGIKHFHKPPLTYWMTAFGLDIFGVNGLGARFFPAVFSVLTLIYTRRMTFTLTGDRDKAQLSVLILASSVLFLVVSRVISTDIYLTFFTVAALAYMFEQIYGNKTLKNAVFMGMLFGLGFLTKGPIIFLFSLLPFAVICLFDRDHRRAFGWFDYLLMLIMFVVVALPWYIGVVTSNDGLLKYFLYDQTVERVTDAERFSRSEPLYFFPLIILGTFLPWLFYFFSNIRNSNFVKGGWHIYLYVLIPFIVFECSASKLATYILPFYPVMAVLASGRAERPLIPKAIGYIFVVLGGLVALVPLFVEHLREFWMFIAGGSAAYVLLMTAMIEKKWFIRRYHFSVSAAIILLTLLIYGGMTFAGPYIKGYRLSGEDIKKFDPQGKYDVIIYAAFTPSLSFYLDRVVPIAFGKRREVQFQTYDEYKNVWMNSNDELVDYLNQREEYILFTYRKNVDRYIALTGDKCELISDRGEKKVAYFCKKGTRPGAEMRLGDLHRYIP